MPLTPATPVEALGNWASSTLTHSTKHSECGYRSAEGQLGGKLILITSFIIKQNIVPTDHNPLVRMDKFLSIYFRNYSKLEHKPVIYETNYHKVSTRTFLTSIGLILIPTAPYLRRTPITSLLKQRPLADQSIRAFDHTLGTRTDQS